MSLRYTAVLYVLRCISVQSVLDRGGHLLFMCVICRYLLTLYKVVYGWGWVVAMVERYWQGKTAVLGDKYAQDPLCWPQIPLGLSLCWTNASRCQACDKAHTMALLDGVCGRMCAMQIVQGVVSVTADGYKQRMQLRYRLSSACFVVSKLINCQGLHILTGTAHTERDCTHWQGRHMLTGTAQTDRDCTHWQGRHMLTGTAHTDRDCTHCQNDSLTC